MLYGAVVFVCVLVGAAYYLRFGGRVVSEQYMLGGKVEQEVELWAGRRYVRVIKPVRRN